MEGKSVADYTFSKKNQAITLASQLYVSVDGDKIEIEPQILYQRLLVAGIGSVEPESLLQ